MLCCVSSLDPIRDNAETTTTTLLWFCPSWDVQRSYLISPEIATCLPLTMYCANDSAALPK